MPRCVAVGCNENGSHHFPRDVCLRKLWEKATKIANFKATRNSRLCSKHFKESDYQGLSSTTGKSQVCKHLRKGVVPSIFSWTKTATELVSERAKRYTVRTSKRQFFPAENIQVTEEIVPMSEDKHYSPNLTTQQQCINVVNSTIQPVENVPELQMEIEIESETVVTIQNDNKSENRLTTLTRYNMSTQTPHINRFLTNDQLLSDSKSVKFYTGLESFDKFKMVFSTLIPMVHHLTYRNSQVLNISVEDQFLLMLIKLRRNKCDFELSKFFDISTTEVGNVFVTWVNFVYQMWSKLDLWPGRGLVDYYMPTQFKRNHRSTRVIIDGTEVPITRPKNPKAQQATFSTYKHHNTVKFLVGSTPGGLFSYCSEGYAGSTSDRQIIERSTLIEICEAKDAIMADRGFNVQDLFAPKDVSILIPNFLKGISQLPSTRLKHDRKLAANRIHIERLIGLAKTYAILKSDLNPYYVPLISKFFYICIMLCNLRDNIVS